MKMKNGLSLLLLKSTQMGVCGFSSVATMGCRRFFQTTTESSLVKRDMFRVGDIPILFSGRQSLGCFVPHQCNKSHMLPYFARSIASSSASHSSAQTPQQELKKKEKKCQIVRSSKLQRERCDETYSTEVSLNQFPGLMVPGMVKNSKTRGLLRLNPDTGYFEQEQDVAAAANHDHSHHSELQVPHGHVCRGSAYGWLFLTDDKLDMKLLNPFSGAEIKLPPVKALPPSESKDRWLPCKWFVSRAVFSANPSVEPRPVVLVIYGGQHIPRLAFCKPGDERWTPLEFPIKRHFQWCYVWPRDAVYHNGQFFVLSNPGYVAAFDIGRCIDDDDLSVKTTLVATAQKREIIYMRDWYLVMLDGKLVRFEFRQACFCDCCIEETKEMMEKERMRDGDTTDEDYTDANSDKDYDFNYADADEDSETEVETENEDGDNDDDVGKRESTCRPDCIDLNLPSHTYGIKIRRFDESEQQWVKVESLGDKAVFLGYNTSFALSASDYPAGHCVPDSIYFTYGEGGNQYTEMVCYDMGIYNEKDKSVKRPLYPPMPTDDDSDASKFKKPAPIWIVDAADDTESKVRDDRIFTGSSPPGKLRVSSMHPRLSALLLKSPQKGLLPSLLALGSRLVVSSSAATATMGSRRFSNTCLGGGGGAPIHQHHHVSFNQFPGIMVPGTVKKSETWRFQRFNPNSGSFADNCNPLPVPHGYACHGSAYGWLFLVGDELDTKLMNPFTGEEIQLPSVKTLPRASYGWMGINKLYVLKAVFSSNTIRYISPLGLSNPFGLDARRVFSTE